MLPPEVRLRKSRDFERIYQAGRRVASPHLRLLYLKTNQRPSRFGFVISQHQVQKATMRNRLKRISRALVESKQVLISPGFDIIIQIKSGAANLSSKEIREELKQLLVKSKLISL